MQPLPVFNAIFQDITLPDGSQELGVMVLGEIPTSGSRIQARLRNVGPVEVTLDALIDSGTDTCQVDWSTWRYAPGSMRDLETSTPDVWHVTRWGGRRGTEPRTLYRGPNEQIARDTYANLVTDMRQGDVRLTHNGEIVAVKQAPTLRTKW